jgi:REP element-mobilizing transposase RayT
MAHTYTQLFYHLVFATKERRPWLAPEVRPRVHAYLGAALRDEGGSALVINGTADHVHILARLRQDKAVSDVLRAIKANSSGWVHRTFPEQHAVAWQSGYAAFTVSASQVPIVRRYIENQEEHHRAQSFENEFVALLKKHGIEYDERYLWD